MENKPIMAVTKDGHSIAIFEVESGNFISTIFVTSGQIIGQPSVTPTTVYVTYIEGGNTYTNVYSNPSFNFISRITNSI